MQERLYKEQCMEKIVSTVEELESVLLVAFGPCGQAVLVQQPTGQFTITRSGLDILTAYFPSRQKNPYLRILLDCVRTLHKDLGDGVNDADNRGSLDDLDIQCEVNRVIQEHKATKKESKDNILGILLLTSAVLPDLSVFCLGREGVSIVQGIPFEEMSYIHSVLMTLQHSADTDCLVLAVKSETVGSKEYTWLDLPNVSQLILSAPTPEICLLYSQACNNALKLVSVIVSPMSAYYLDEHCIFQNDQEPVAVERKDVPATLVAVERKDVPATLVAVERKEVPAT
uniref:Uncharacterized protein n=1 Tax=Timema genevievae TaxID=629358 RepID=A0A7R9JVT1_TIMGE|nr:unnamed protein product [Timema genevievae]